MSLILVANIGELKYYVSLDREGRYYLNGLEDNACKFRDESEIGRKLNEIKFHLKNDLTVKTIKP